MNPQQSTYKPVNPLWFKLLIIGSVSVLALLLIMAFLQQPVHDNTAQLLAMKNMESTGVTNPVTAVLLNYRAYDTFMEFAVFLCVAIAVLPYVLDADAGQHKASSESQILGIARIFVPLSVVMAGYMLWIGSSKPGGAFQAAALLAGCLVLLSLANVTPVKFSLARIRLLLVAGFMVFASLTLVLLCYNQGFIVFPVNLAGLMLLLIEFFATFSISITLFLCFESIHRGHL